MPTGWVLNGTTSNGSTWIAGDNNEMITSDFTHGIGGSIQIRARNSCGTGQSSNHTVSIPITRPVPILDITGGLNTICSGTSTYSVTGVPSGATVSWSISDMNLATIPNPSTGTSVTVTMQNTGNVTLTATVTDCIQSYPVDRPIRLGSPYTPATVNGPDTALSTSGYYFSLSTTPWNLEISNITWQVPTGWSISTGQGTRFTTIYTGTTEGDVEVEFDDACGQTWNVYRHVVIGEGGDIWPIRTANNPITVSVTPNPATDQVKVTLHEKGVKLSKGFIKEIRISDKMGNLKKKFVYPSNTLNLKVGNHLVSQIINVRGLAPDTYTVQVNTGKAWVSCKLLILK